MEGLTVGSVVSGIIASVLLLAIGYFFEKGRTYWATRHFRKIWHPYVSSPSAKVVLTTRSGPKVSSTPRVSLAEVRAFQNIEHISARIGVRFDLLESTIESSTLSQESIILLGGPIANNVAKHFWPEVEKRVPYAISLETQSISSANATYEPKEDADGLLSVDYSLVVKMRRNSGKFLFLFAGCHGFGTSGSTRIVSDPDLVRDLAKRVGDREFVAIVKSTINKGIVDAVEVVDAYNFA